MRIAYITDETFPNHEASGLQMIHTLSALAAVGVDVDLLFPVKPLAWRQDKEALRATLQAHFHATCGFGLVPLPTHLGDRRVPIKLATGVAATRAALSGGYDLVHTRTVAPILPCLRARVPVVFETYRPLTRQFPASRFAFKRVGRHPAFAGIITHSRLARRAFVEDGVPAEKVETIYNGFDPSAFAVQRTPSEARALLGLPEAPTVVYTGRIAPVKNIDLLLDAAAKTQGGQWVLAGANDTEEAQPYVERARGMGVHLPGYLTGERLTLCLQAADVLVIPPSADPLTRFGTTVLPIKLFTYVAAGRAIVAGRLPDAQELLDDGQNACLVKPDDVDALAGAVSALLADPARRDRLARGALATAAGLTWEARAHRIRAFVEGRLDRARLDLAR
ncbi:MAG: glycosyltransferase family 4 protein [Myxococcales bacterium]|nr:glycosyltransferase family 4 protein [Myxococcales bacterium]